MILSLKVSVSPEWDEIHSNFSRLIRLSNIATHFSKFTSTQGNMDETSARNSPCCSPMHNTDSSKLFELLTPVKMLLPQAPTTEELSNFHALATNFTTKQKDEKQYIGLIFEEYCKRKGIMQKREKEFNAFIEEFAELQRRDLPPSIRQALAMVKKQETSARGEVLAAYDQFLRWIEQVQPQWLEVVNRQIEENRMKEEAKKATFEASKALLVQELAAGRKLSSMSANSVGVLGCSMDSSYVPNVLDHATHEEPSPTALRHKAIELLEQQEAVMRHCRKRQLLELKLKEESLRKQIQDKETKRLAEEEKKRKDNWEQLHKSLLQQECALQGRLRAREAERRQKEKECRMLLEHCLAEEEIIRRRLKEQKDRQKAMEEEKKHLEDQKKRELYEHILAEEELLRQRMRQREVEIEIEKQRQARVAEEELQKKNEELERAIRLREQHDSLAKEREVLRRAKEEHEKAKRAKQVALLKQQEEAFRARLRPKELAEIQAKEQKLQNQAQQQMIYPSAFFLPIPQPAPSPNEVATLSYVPGAHALAATSDLLRYAGATPGVPSSTYSVVYQVPAIAPSEVVIQPAQACQPYYSGHVPNDVQPTTSSNPAVVYPKVDSWDSTGVPYLHSSPLSTVPVGEYGYLEPPLVQAPIPQYQGGSWQQPSNVFGHRL